MIQVKMFTAISLTYLERDINDFLTNNDCVFVNLIWTVDDEYSCCLVYKVNKQRQPYEKY